MQQKQEIYHKSVKKTMINTHTLRKSISKEFFKHYQLYIMLLLPISWYIIFQYLPMYGIQIAFKNFNPIKGIIGSPWVGLKNFNRFFSSFYFWNLIWNTISLNIYSLIVGFPIPIVLAIIVNEIKGKHFKKVLQNITYIPHFLSVVVVVGMLYIFLSPQTGLINILLKNLGFQSVAFMEKAEWFKTIYVFSDVWQEAGWTSIIYIAALAGVDASIYEAAIVDGASRFQRIIYVSIPSILPTIIILLILRIGQLMNVGFEKVLLMQNSLNMSSSDVISTFIYRYGVQQGEYSYTAAVGLFNSLINFTVLILANTVAKRKSESSLW
ncbi:MAG: transporter permease subunit [Clostridiales bacterium]|nr:transporter permease subunit [Clostridiales bacterium]